MCPHGKAHCRHLANTTEQFVCGGDVVLCQITLTTCYYYYECLVVKIPWAKNKNTRMWANAQRDGRPAEYRWRPLFNAAKFGC